MERVSKSNLCPVCEHSDWCLVSPDGSACICARVSEGGTVVGKEGAGWLHKLTNNPTPRKRTPKRHKAPQEPLPDFLALARKYHENLPDMSKLSANLGVSEDSLERLRVGWDGKNYTFPLRDGQNRIIGIRLRGKTKKFAVKGSKNALFWPEGVRVESENILFICEGPTDTAALLDLGFEAIGRANSNTGASYILEMLKGMKRHIVIMADKDEAKTRTDGSIWYPGIEGAVRLAEQIKPVSETLRVIKPPNHKDIRSWYNNGATKSAVMALVNNERFV